MIVCSLIPLDPQRLWLYLLYHTLHQSVIRPSVSK